MIWLWVTWIVLSEINFIINLLLHGTREWFATKLVSFFQAGIIMVLGFMCYFVYKESGLNLNEILAQLGWILLTLIGIGLFVLLNWGIVKLVDKK